MDRVPDGSPSFARRPAYPVDNQTEPILPVDERFDASQYAFFGRGITEEVEIGGLEEEEDPELEGSEDGEESSSLGAGREELNRNAPKSDGGSSGTPETGPTCDGMDAVIPLSQPFECIPTTNWLEHTSPDTEVRREPKKWWLNNQAPSRDVDDTLRPLLHHTHQQKKLWVEADTNYSEAVPHGAQCPPQRTSQALQGASSGQVQLMQNVSGQSPAGALPGEYRQPTFQPPMGGMTSMTPFNVSLTPQYSSSGPMMTQIAPPMQWLAPSYVKLGHVPGSNSQQLPQNTSLLPHQVMLHYQHPHALPLHGIPHPPYPHHLKPQQIYSGAPLVQVIPKMRDILTGDSRDHSQFRGRQTQRYNQHGSPDGNSSGKGAHSNCWQPLRSKYMTVEEIENIVRIQWAATHSSDPYIDDYYHQALQAKLSSGSSHGRRHFAPSHLRDLPSHTRAAIEPHAYLQVDALGRVPYSSIRRPRPLLEVDPAAGSVVPVSAGQYESFIDGVSQNRPLEQEPMLAARIAVEDGLCLLLDVDDIDRLLSSAEPPDGGVQLRRRRQLLLEGLAASLQLEDATDSNASGHCSNGLFMGRIKKDDLVFRRLVSLPKGRKLVTRYLHLLTPGSELVRTVTMAVFRHLRFLFGGVQSDPSTSATTTDMANAASLAVFSMDLPSLSACLAAVVLAPDQPPLRPMGSPAGDGATVILRAVLERATSLLTDRTASYPLQNRALWQASFDAFFALLAKYCTNKYDSIFHSLMMASPGSSAAINTAAAAAMSKEMPVELLRASLPHTNDHQRKLLLEFAQRSMVMGAFPCNTGSDVYASMVAVPK